jgi:hypothetical protein
MPLDNSFEDARQSIRAYTGWLAHGVLTSNDWGLNRITGWKLKRCWLPQRCFLTGKKLWSKQAYYGVNVITGPGDPITEPYWVDKHEFILWQIKGN